MEEKNAKRVITEDTAELLKVILGKKTVILLSFLTSRIQSNCNTQ